jgi:hypothetical protein
VNALVKSVHDWAIDMIGTWDRFWFAPAQPHTLAMIRILAGSMLFYTHLIWSLDLMSFLGPHSWITGDVARQVHSLRGDYAWSYLWYFDSPNVLWTLHILALVVFAMFTLGLFSRVTAVLAFLITVAYCHRLEGALFGLDQINAMLAMYVMLGPCGGAYSMDRLIARWRSGDALSPPQDSVGANVAVRLIQLHMCIIYLFGGLAKMKGGSWWDGSAMWLSIVNLEYQSWDLTWLAHYQLLIALLTHVTVFWETFYCVLVWPRVTRPIMIFLAVCVHGGIALFLGMKTFGLVMLIGNLAFISPQTIRALVTAGASIFRWEPEQVSKVRAAVTER